MVMTRSGITNMTNPRHVCPDCVMSCDVCGKNSHVYDRWDYCQLCGEPKPGLHVKMKRDMVEESDAWTEDWL